MALHNFVISLYFQLISGQWVASWESWWKVVWYSKALIVSFPGTFPAMFSINTKGSRSSKGKCRNSRLYSKEVLIIFVKLVSQIKWLNFMFSLLLDLTILLTHRIKLNQFIFLILLKITYKKCIYSLTNVFWCLNENTI